MFSKRRRLFAKHKWHESKEFPLIGSETPRCSVGVAYVGHAQRGRADMKFLVAGGLAAQISCFISRCNNICPWIVSVCSPQEVGFTRTLKNSMRLQRLKKILQAYAFLSTVCLPRQSVEQQLNRYLMRYIYCFIFHLEGGRGEELTYHDKETAFGRSKIKKVYYYFKWIARNANVTKACGNAQRHVICEAADSEGWTRRFPISV